MLLGQNTDKNIDRTSHTDYVCNGDISYVRYS